MRRRLGDSAEIAEESLKRFSERVTFQTSGSTGKPKRVTHAWAHLAAETEAGADLFPDARRVAALVPPHHIYGWLWTVPLPAARGLPVLDARGRAPAAPLREARAGDLIVATPFLCSLLLRAGAKLPDRVTGLTSTAPAPPALWLETRAMGLARLVELYGSTETGGVGWRDARDAPLSLMPHLTAEGGTLRRRRDGAALAPPDRLAWDADGRFRPAGRTDGAVQVGGVNVWPERVAATLGEHPAVADCAVRLDPESGRPQGLRGSRGPRGARPRGAARPVLRRAPDPARAPHPLRCRRDAALQRDRQDARLDPGRGATAGRDPPETTCPSTGRPAAHKRLPWPMD